MQVKTEREIKKRKYATKVAKKTNSRRYRKAMNVGLPIPYPSSFRTTLKYADYMQITQTTAGTPVSYQFLMNSLYDCDYTGTGHQPYFFDQLCNSTMYQRYTVFGCKVIITATSNNPCEILVRPSISTTPPTNISLESERPKSKSIMINNGQNSRTLSQYYSISKIWGVAKRKVSDEDSFTGTYNSSPASPAFLNIMVYNPDASYTVTANIHIRLKFYCKLYDRHPVGQS